MLKVSSIKLFICLILFQGTTLFAQDLSGTWNGLLEVQGLKIRLNINLVQTNGQYTGTLDSPDQGASGIPISKVTLENNAFGFSVDAAGLSYSGTLDREVGRIEGVFMQGGQKLPLAFQKQGLTVQEGSTEWIRRQFDKQEVYIEMRDGVRLFTSIYTPKDKSKKYPMLMTRTPYNIEGGGPQGLNRHLSSRINLIKEGYIFVFQDVRGKFMSEGTFMDVRPFMPNKKSPQDIDENSDTYDTIDWLVKNVEGNNGNVGIFGVSYPGFYSTISLMDAHPALKAVSPQAPVTDWFVGDDFHHNGAFFMMDAFSFYSGFGRPRPEPTREGKPGFQHSSQDNYKFFLELGPIKNAAEKYFGDSIQFWSDLMSHPNYDAFWKARNPRPHLKNVRPAVLTVGGWFDAEDSFGPLAVYKAIERQNTPQTSNRLLMGPWAHGQWSGGVANNLGNIHWGFNTGEKYKELETNFFRHYLKGEGPLDIAEATVFVSGSNEWKEFPVWPPSNSEERTLYFQPKGGLAFEKPTASAGFREYLSDPAHPVPYTEDVHLSRTTEYMVDDQRFASRRPDVLTYQTPILEKDMTFTGPLVADLWVSTTGTDADFVIKLIDVFPDSTRTPADKNIEVPLSGYQMMVRGEIIRGRFRNSLEKPEPFTPGQVAQVKFEIPDVAHTFKKGHRVMIQVQSSWFPLVDRNPQKFVDIYNANESDFQKATHRVYHSSTHPSALKVRILK